MVQTPWKTDKLGRYDKHSLGRQSDIVLCSWPLNAVSFVPTLHGAVEMNLGKMFIVFAMLSSANSAFAQWLPLVHDHAFNGIHDLAIKICIKPQDQESKHYADRASEWANVGLRQWLKEVNQIDGSSAKSVVHSCASPHYTIKLYSPKSFPREVEGSMRSYVKLQESANMYTHTAALTAGLFTHEFGHAFASLDDTYVAEKPGVCKKGQPKSIMCYEFTGTHKLLSDDIEGVKARYCTYLMVKIATDDFVADIMKFEGLREVAAGRSLRDLKLEIAKINYEGQCPSSIMLRSAAFPTSADLPFEWLIASPRGTTLKALQTHAASWL
jgi:hypothetical protein